jgi:branched-chain amino acid transport system permease protein
VTLATELQRWGRWFLPGLAVLLVILALFPIWATGYGVRVMLQLFMWIALAQSWNLISGLTGYVSFGHVAFFGMGAYTTGILVTRGMPWPLAALAGGAMAVVLAFVIGWPCLRLKGPYFAIAMLGLNEVLRVAASYFEGLTGGGLGLSLPTLDASVRIYYAMGLVALAVTGLTHAIVTSRFGLRLMTIREDEVAAEAMGIDTFHHKLAALLLSAAGVLDPALAVSERTDAPFWRGWRLFFYGERARQL